MSEKENAMSASGWSLLAQRNLAIFVILGLCMVVGIMGNIIKAKDDQIIKCKDDGLATVERLMNQSHLNGMKSDNVYGRQTLVLDGVEEIKQRLAKLEAKKK